MSSLEPSDTNAQALARENAELRGENERQRLEITRLLAQIAGYETDRDAHLHDIGGAVVPGPGPASGEHEARPDTLRSVGADSCSSASGDKSRPGKQDGAALNSCRQRVRELEAQWQDACRLLGNGDLDPSTRLVGFFWYVAYKRERTRGIESPNGEYPVSLAFVGKLSGLNNETVRTHSNKISDMGLLARRTVRRAPTWKVLPDGTREKDFTPESYAQLLPAPNRYLSALAKARPANGRTHGGKREQERNEAGKFSSPTCQDCGGEGTLEERVTVTVRLVCTGCGSVTELHQPEETKTAPKRQSPRWPQDAAIITTQSVVMESRSPEAPPDPQINGEKNGHKAPTNVEAPRSPQDAAIVTAQTAAPVDGTIAVLDAGALHVANGRQIESHPANGKQPLATMLDHAAKGGIEQLWMTPAWVEARGLPASIELNSHEHTFTTAATDAGWTLRPGGLARWVSARRERERGYDAVYVGFPGYDTETELSTATDGRTMLEALVYFERATKQRYLGHPLKTSARILKTSNPGKPLHALELPECAEDRRLEWDLAWMSVPSLEETDGRYVHSYDRNGAYLAVCSSLTVGAGALYHCPDVPVVDPKKAAYWYARIEHRTEHPAGWIPDPFHDEKHPAGEWHWRTSQTMALAIELGASIECREAWMWGQTQRPLERWYKRLRDARLSLADSVKYPNREAAELARGIAKSCHTRMSGRFTKHLTHARDDDALFRPDIRHAIIAAARANMARTIRQCAAVERAPILVATDALYFLSDSPDPEAGKPAPLELSAQLGKWKIEGTWNAHEFCAAMWERGATPARVVKAARDIQEAR